jgi:putative peptide zinc metalloprotease protein
MAVTRPTFHEAWYRVADLHPRLLSVVHVYRQYFRGVMWYVLENPSNNQYSRISDEAYRFIGILDGRRTVSEAWRICNEQLGDRAPTQGEVIQLLGQLYSVNLLYADLPPDSESLFNRYRKRVGREVKGQLMNLLFIRIPLIDPDHFLDRWVGIVGRLFSWYGFIFWSILLATGLFFVVGNFRELFNQSSDILAPDNLILLYLSFVIIKIFHEFSHAFACKKFGQLNQSRGQVHIMGVMFLVFFPLPYVDASSAWAFRNRWHRAVVGMAGVMAELSLAAIAAIIWANTSTGTPHIIAYNVIFVASISTLLFNGNPLLRFDAYYVLSDLIEIPNLGQRSRNYIYYLVKRYIWGVKRAQNPAYTFGEGVWFVIYGLASMAFRVFICVRILIFLNDRLPEELFILVPLFALSAIVAWVFVPFGKFVQYLATGAELTRNRNRAVGSTLVTFCLIIIVLGLIRLPDYWRVEGIVEPVNLAIVHAESDGFVVGYLPSESKVSSGITPLIRAVNPDLEAEKKSAIAERISLEVQRRIAETQEIAAAQILDEQIEALNEKIARLEDELESLNLKPSISGTWVAPDIEHSKGAYFERGKSIGFVANLDDVIIRAIAGQNVPAMLVKQFLFSIELEFESDLDNRIISKELRGEFEEAQILLSEHVTVSVEQQGSAWMIRDDWNEYFVRKEEGRLNVHIEQKQALKQVEIRVKGQPKLLLTGEIEKIFPAGQELLPSEALGYAVGGSVPTASQDPQGTKAAEMFFEIRIRPNADSSIRLLTGQRVITRIRMRRDKPLIQQWWRSARQLFQRRFHI